MKLTRRRHDDSANSMYWDWPIVRRKYLYDDLRRHRPVWRHAEWMKVCDAIESLPAFEKRNNFGNDYVDLRDLAGKIPKKTKTDRRIFKAWEQARSEEEKRRAAIEIELETERERTRQWRRLQEARVLLKEIRRLLRDRGRARSRGRV
jgi:hypothetical protein